MTTFALKLLAVLTMLIDHCGAVFGDAGALDWSTTLVLREIGRLSFPIYAFLAAVGWKKTRDRAAYLRRMLAGGLLSAVPYALAFAYDAAPGLAWNWNGWQSALFALLLLCALYGCLWGADGGDWRTALLTAAFLTLPGISLSVGGAAVLWREQSIFYTLAYALFLLSCLRKPAWRDVWRLPVAVLFPVLYAFDYGVFGALLVVGLYLCRKKWQDPIVLAVFAYLLYLTDYVCTQNWIYAGCFCLAAAPVLLYNGRKGPGGQRWFYAVYPVHLLALGLIRYLLLEG